VLDVGFEGQGVRGSLYGHRLAHGPFEGDRGDQGGVLAAVARDPAVGPLSPRALALRRAMEVTNPRS
jgi:hypothetical protein